MKRGIVMEVKRNKAVILTESGQFETIRLPKNGEIPEIGDTVSMADRGVGFAGKKRAGRWLPIISAVSAILIFVVLLGGVFPSHPDKTVAAYVSYDVNPSFSAAVNGNLQVVSVKTWNQDAAKLFANRDSYYLMGLKEFSHQVVQTIAGQGYFDGPSHVLIATTIVLQNQQKRAKLQSSLQKAVNDIRSDDLLTQHHVLVSVKKANPETRKKANAHGLSVGKYLLYVDAENSGLPLSISDIKQMSVSDIEHKMQAKPVDEEPVLTAVVNKPETVEDLQPVQSNSLKEPPADTKVGHKQVKEKKNHGNQKKDKKDKSSESKGHQDKAKHHQKDKQKAHSNKGKAHHHKQKVKKDKHKKQKGNAKGHGKSKSKHPDKHKKKPHGKSKPEQHSDHHENDHHINGHQADKKEFDLPLFNKIFNHLEHDSLHVDIQIGEKAG